jgi:hypothetical protein
MYIYNKQKMNMFNREGDTWQEWQGATDVPPPPPVTGHVHLFIENEKKWKTVVSNIGKKAYIKDTKQEIEWGGIEPPPLDSFCTFTKPLPTEIWSKEQEAWVHIQNKEERELLARGIVTIPLLDTIWKIDLVSQWAIQIAENQAYWNSKKVIVQDALGKWHRLSRKESNLLQKEVFRAYAKHEGYIST